MNEDVMAEISVNKLLIAILESIGPVTIPTLTLLDAANVDKQIVLSYDEEEPPSFIVSLRDVNGSNE